MLENDPFLLLTSLAHVSKTVEFSVVIFPCRVGRRSDNVKLYCNVLDEMARCCKHGGRAALLTGDMNNMIKVRTEF